MEPVDSPCRSRRHAAVRLPHRQPRTSPASSWDTTSGRIRSSAFLCGCVPGLPGDRPLPDPWEGVHPPPGATRWIPQLEQPLTHRAWHPAVLRLLGPGHHRRVCRSTCPPWAWVTDLRRGRPDIAGGGAPLHRRRAGGKVLHRLDPLWTTSQLGRVEIGGLLDPVLALRTPPGSCGDGWEQPHPWLPSTLAEQTPPLGRGGKPGGDPVGRRPGAGGGGGEEEGYLPTSLTERGAVGQVRTGGG